MKHIGNPQDGQTLCSAPVKAGDGQAVTESADEADCTRCLSAAITRTGNLLGALHKRLDRLIHAPVPEVSGLQPPGRRGRGRP